MTYPFQGEKRKKKKKLLWCIVCSLQWKQRCATSWPLTYPYLYTTFICCQVKMIFRVHFCSICSYFHTSVAEFPLRETSEVQSSKREPIRKNCRWHFWTSRCQFSLEAVQLSVASVQFEEAIRHNVNQYLSDISPLHFPAVHIMKRNLFFTGVHCIHCKIYMHLSMEMQCCTGKVFSVNGIGFQAVS